MRIFRPGMKDAWPFISFVSHPSRPSSPFRFSVPMPKLASFQAFFVRSHRLGVVLTVGLWLLGVGAGFRVLVDYEMTPGLRAAVPSQWPAASGLSFDSKRTNLVMFAHPQCPCSQASMNELAVIMTRCPQQVHATVCFIDLEGEPAEWTHSALWRDAAAIPGVEVIADRNGRLAEQFGSSTSGQVLVFDRAGRKLFSGGITGARGHEGDNRGRQAVIALARGEFCATTATPVFGCALQDAPQIGAVR
jgi:hypothetical protein